MRFLQRERAVRILRPILAVSGLVAAIWHATHAVDMWLQSKAHRPADPALADFFWQHLHKEIAIATVSMLAGVVAWRLFKPGRPVIQPQSEPR